MNIDEAFKKEIVYQIKNSNQGDVKRNLVYKYDDQKAYLMDVYTPNLKKANAELPAVILVHGEAKDIPNMKDAGQYTSLGKLITASGLKAITFNHRVLSDGFSIQEVIQDINSLMDYIINNSRKLGIDKDRIAIWSFSGGSPFGLYMGMSFSDHVRCIISYYGFCDFQNVNRFFSMNISEDTIEKYSAVNFISQNPNLIPPIFIARAGLDSKAINQSIEEFVKEALRYNLSIDILNHPTGHHGFDLFDDNHRTYEIMDKTLDFLNANLLNQ